MAMSVEDKIRSNTRDLFYLELEKIVQENEPAEGFIYCRWHYSDGDGEQNKKLTIRRLPNKESVRWYLYCTERKNRGRFYYSTDGADLVLDVGNPNRPLKVGPYAPECPNAIADLDQRDIARRREFRFKTKKKLLAALAQETDPIATGQIHYRWHYTDHNSSQLRTESIANTQAIRDLLEELHVRYPNQFYYSCDINDLTPRPIDGITRPRQGTLLPPDSSGQPSTSASSGAPTYGGTITGLGPIHYALLPTAAAPITATSTTVSPMPLVYTHPSSVVPLPELPFPAMTTPMTVTTTTEVAPAALASVYADLNDIMIETDDQNLFNQLLGLVVDNGEQVEAENLDDQALDLDDLYPTSDVPLDEWNALVDFMDEGDEKVGDIEGMDYNIIGESAAQFEEAQEQPDLVMKAMQEANMGQEGVDHVDDIADEEQDRMADYQPREGTSTSSAPSATVSVPTGSPPPVYDSPHTAAAPVPSSYVGPSIPIMVIPTTAMTTTTAVTTTDTSGIYYLYFADPVMLAMYEANLNASDPENPEN